MARSSGAPDPQDRNKVVCDLKIWICGDVIDRRTSIDRRGGQCPAEYVYTSVPTRQVCCDSWRSSKRPNAVCNGAVDADCDGVPNEDDTDPLTPDQ